MPPQFPKCQRGPKQINALKLHEFIYQMGIQKQHCFYYNCFFLFIIAATLLLSLA